MTEICKTLINDINLCNSISDTIVFKPDMFSKHTLAGLTISAYSKYAVLPHYYNDQQLLCNDECYIDYLQLAIGTINAPYFLLNLYEKRAHRHSLSREYNFSPTSHLIKIAWLWFDISDRFVATKTMITRTKQQLQYYLVVYIASLSFIYCSSFINDLDLSF